MTSLALLLLLCQDPSPAPPVPVDAVAVITDRHGGPVPERVNVGSVLVLSARRSEHGDKPRSVLWRVSPKSVADRSEALTILESDGSHSPVYLIPVGSQAGTLTVELVVAKGDTADVKSISIEVIGDGTDPRPPPPKPGPGPQPEPKPEPKPVPADQTFRITAVYNPMAVTPAQSTVLNNFDWRADYKRRGHSFVIATTSTQDQQCKDAIEAARLKGIAIPFLLFTDQTGKVADVIPWTDSDAVDAAVKRLGGR